jgi:hypothetical protein
MKEGVHYLNIKPYFNRRAVMGKDEDGDGESPRFSAEHFVFGEQERGGVSARFERAGNGFDGIVCKGQVIEADSVPCDTAIIVGTCCWGYYAETLRLVFSDGSEDAADARYYDWCWPIPDCVPGQEPEAAWNNSHGHVFAEYPKYGGGQGVDYIFYSKTELKTKGRKLARIVLPDNIFMTVFAITLCAGDKAV